MFSPDVLKRLNTLVGDFQPVVSQTEELLKKAIKGAKIPNVKTIGSVVYDGGFDPTEFIKKIDPKNLAGSVPFALELVEKLKNLGGPEQLLQELMGSNLFGLIQQIQQGLQSGLSMAEEMRQAAEIIAGQNRGKKKTKKDGSQAKKKAKEHIDKIRSGES
jgi:hypothetical protein